MADLENVTDPEKAAGFERLLARERSFQRYAVAVAVALFLAVSMPVSVARAMFGPAEQFAEAGFVVDAGGAVHFAVDMPAHGLRYAKYRRPPVPRHVAKRRIERRPDVPLLTVPPATVAFFEPPLSLPVPGLQTMTPSLLTTGFGGPPVLTGDIGPGEVIPRITPISPVPEPASWLMMILGVGIIGGMLRHGRARRSQALSA